MVNEVRHCQNRDDRKLIQERHCVNQFPSCEAPSGCSRQIFRGINLLLTDTHETVWFRSCHNFHCRGMTVIHCRSLCVAIVLPESPIALPVCRTAGSFRDISSSATVRQRIVCLRDVEWALQIRRPAFSIATNESVLCSKSFEWDVTRSLSMCPVETHHAEEDFRFRQLFQRDAVFPSI
jgi:hypothetical protein